MVEKVFNWNFWKAALFEVSNPTLMFTLYSVHLIFKDFGMAYFLGDAN